jgi:hypothetical protein
MSAFPPSKPGIGLTRAEADDSIRVKPEEILPCQAGLCSSVLVYVSTEKDNLRFLDFDAALRVVWTFAARFAKLGETARV